MIKIVCPNCFINNNIKFHKEICGKRLSVKCKNDNCDEVIHFLIPHIQPGTVVLNEIDENDNFLQTFIDHDVGDHLLRHPILKSINVIGRKTNIDEADIGLDTADTSVSRKHCIIEKIVLHNRAHFVLSDNNSKNGVILNEERLDQEDEIYLKNGDVIRLGLTKLNFIQL